MSYILAGTAVAGALTGIASAIANTKDMNQRRRFVQNLAGLDYDQKVTEMKFVRLAPKLGGEGPKSYRNM